MSTGYLCVAASVVFMIMLGILALLGRYEAQQVRFNRPPTFKIVASAFICILIAYLSLITCGISGVIWLWYNA